MPRFLVVVAFVLLIRLPFLNQAIQGDDYYYLAAAQHAQVEPAHPHHARYVFLGIPIDMRGHPHPPGNAWVLAGLLAVFKDIREIPFHAVYAAFSLLAAWGMWRLARQYIPERAIEATLMFCAVPAFVVNGNSLEADIPFLAFWMLSVAGVATGLSLALASLMAYQSVVLIPILWLRKRSWIVLIPVLVFVTYQVAERVSAGDLPAQVLAGHFQTYQLQAGERKIRNAIALTGHLIMMFSPLGFVGLLLGFRRRIQPWMLTWIGIFFTSALILFFAGSARYLLPLAAPFAIIVATVWRDRPKFLWACFGMQALLGLSLAWVNYQHWNGYREATRSIYRTHSGRTWVNGEWGLRFYAESMGALPITRGQELRQGDLVITSDLAGAIPYTTGGAQAVPLAEYVIRPTLPLRLLGAGTGSAYSTADHGLFPFGWSSAPADTVRLFSLVEHKPQLSWLPMNAPEAQSQIVSGVNDLENGQWRWMAGRATFLLKPPPGPLPIEAELYIPDASPARRFKLLLDGRVVAEKSFSAPGKYTLRTEKPVQGSSEVATIVLEADQEFSPPNDGRKLSAILTAIGFRQ